MSIKKKLEPELATTSIDLGSLPIFLTEQNQRIEYLESIVFANKPEPIRLPINLNEASELMRLSVSRVYVLASQNKIPHNKRGGRIYFFQDELLEFIRTGKRNGGTTHE